jgi:hypothetical protein
MADPQDLCRHISRSGFTIAAVGGARHLNAIGIVTDVIRESTVAMPQALCLRRGLGL